MKIWGDMRSGNCLKVKYVCDYLAIPYEWIELDVLSGKTREDEFRSINPMGQIPVIQLEDGRSLAQSSAIISYLARDSNLIPETPFEYAEMNQWLFWEQYSHEPYISVRRFLKLFLKKTDDEIDPRLMKKGNAALDLMEERLTDNDYILGDSISVADIALLPYTQVSEEGGFDLNSRENISNWIARLGKTLEIQ